VTARRHRYLFWVLALATVLFLEAGVVEPRILLIRRIEVTVVGLPEEWNGGTVMQLSDPPSGLSFSGRVACNRYRPCGGS